MASPLILLALANFLFLIPSTLCQSTTAPAPAGPAGPINVTDILAKGGQYTALLRLMNETRVLDQLPIQLNNSNQGMTLLAPTDNAFLNLPAGTINSLSEQQKVQLVLIHVLPKYYSLDDFSTVSNPVQTQGSGSRGSYGLNFTARGNQVNVSSGVVDTQISNPLRQTFPFAVYSIDKVLLPPFKSEAPAPEASKPSGKPAAKGPSSQAADGDSPPSKNGGGRKMDMGVGLFGGIIVLFCMAFL